jgi:hypothetical protein
VSRTATVSARIQELFREAEETGRSSAFKDGLRRILTTLRTGPREFGEPLFTYHHARLQVRVGIDGPASVRFAVHETAYEVVILDVALLAAG